MGRALAAGLAAGAAGRAVALAAAEAEQAAAASVAWAEQAVRAVQATDASGERPSDGRHRYRNTAMVREMAEPKSSSLSIKPRRINSGLC
jgi:hypothetical protein